MQDEATIAYVEDSSSYPEDQTKIINEVNDLRIKACMRVCR